MRWGFIMIGKKEKTRESILNASYTLFAKKGFKQVTMKDVCEVTGMSRGGLYSHFSGTEKLFEALLEKLTEKIAICPSCFAKVPTKYPKAMQKIANIKRLMNM